MASNDLHHVLYMFPYSICSVMVMYSFACRGEPADPSKKTTVEERQVDIVNTKDHFSEHYLCDVNANGEVPVLVPDHGKPIPDSVAITHYLAKFYPSLEPEEHKAEIQRRLKQLHDISFFTLTFTGQRQRPLAAIQYLNDQLKEDISSRYREAINYKIERTKDKKLNHLTDDHFNTTVERVNKLMGEVEGMLRDSKTDWVFGTKEPTALDAHLVVFVARMQDIHRENLIPETVEQWAEKAMSGEVWKNVMQGRRTMPSAK